MSLSSIQEKAFSFIKERHPSLDFSEAVYKGTWFKIQVTCIKCQRQWMAVPKDLKKAVNACADCYAASTRQRGEELLNNLISERRDLDLSEFTYVNTTTKSKVRCKVCSHKWEAIFNSLKSGSGCIKCGHNRQGLRASRQASERFWSIASERRDLDLSEFTYVNTTTKSKVRCKVCSHKWEATPAYVKRGASCGECRARKTRTNLCRNPQEAVASLTDACPLIDFSEFNYVSSARKSKVKCKLCSHKWEAASYTLKRGDGCPKCNSSRGEKRVAEILDERGITYETEHKVAGRLRLDFYIPSLGIGIEVQGDQHYFVNEFFGGMETFKRQVKNDRRKRQWCKENGVKLISIPYLKKNTDNFERYLRRIHPTREQAHLF